MKRRAKAGRGVKAGTKRPAGKARQPRPKKPRVTLAEKKVEDWLVKRWVGRVRRFFRRDREDSKIPVKEVVKVSGLTRQGVEKFEKGSKKGPLLDTVLRAACTYLRRGWVIVISRKGACFQRSGPMG